MSEHKLVLVTGANKGIGRAIVTAVLERDEATSVLLGSRDLGRGEEARETLIGRNPGWADRIKVVQLDVSDDASVKDAAARVAARFSDDDEPLYGIVNNAGIGLGDSNMERVLNVNTRGPKRVVEAFLPMLREDGRIVNISSASGPNFVADCSEERQAQLTSSEVTWDTVESVMDRCLEIAAGDGDFEAAGFGSGNAYGLSKACLNAYTIELAREHPQLTVNACTPGFIETDLTRPYAESQGVDPSEMGMKDPSEGTRSAIHLLFGDVGGSGWYFGSDAVRSPLDRYRSPGDPPYNGD